MASAPSGTVTFLFTDIEGSTRLAQEHSDDITGLFERHHGILRSSIETHGGYIFQVIGDGFCAAFQTVQDALGAAVEAQTRLGIEAWSFAPVKVRMGISTGSAQVRLPEGQAPDYSSYMNMARVQRIMSLAHGGQILLSSASAELLRTGLQPGMTLRDLGEHRLKGLPNPERLWQVVGPGLQQDFPPLIPLHPTPNNLPAQLTSFIGRQHEMEDVKKLLKAHRLVTLTGSGGTGKTRLSLQIAPDLLADFPDGVWLVELAPIQDGSLIPQTVVHTLGLSLESARQPLDILAEYLPGKSLLIILDNCEHLLSECGSFVQAVLHAQGVKVLATSREGLNLAGEQAYRVPSLKAPDVNHLPDIRQLAQFEAIQLFLERASLVTPDFRLTDSKATALALICQRLDGIPLAIELAAARVKSMPLDVMVSRLDDRFRLLTGGSRNALPRQQTLRATVDWSYSLLVEPERLVLQRLSVFRGGWTLAAAEAVCSGQSIDGLDVQDLLSNLVNKSLLSLDESGRYQMLETVRQYGGEKLIDAGQAEWARDRHLHFMLELADRAQAQSHGPDESAWFDRLQQEIGNLRAALERGLSAGNPEIVLGFSGNLYWFWWVRGYVREAVMWLTGVLDRPGAEKPTRERAKALTALGWLQGALGEHDPSRALFDESIRVSRDLGDKRALAEALSTWCQWIAFDGDVAARPVLEEALAVSRELGYKLGMARALIGNGELQVYQSKDEAAQTSFEQCAALVKELGDSNFLAYAVRRLGHIALRRLGYLDALQLFTESLRLNLQQKDPHGIAACLAAFGSIAAEQGNALRAAKLHGAAAAVLESFGGKMIPLDEFENQPHSLVARAALGDDEYQKALSEGRLMTVEQAIAFALEESLSSARRDDSRP